MGVGAIVIGTDHVNTLGVVRSLGEAKIKVELLILSECCRHKSWVAKSRYVSNFYFCQISESTIIQSLIEIGENHPDKLYIFPCGDYPALVLDKNRKRLEGHYIVPGVCCNQLPLETLMEKSNMISKAWEAGFKIPKTMLCDFPIINEEEIKNYCFYFSQSYPLLIRSAGSSSLFNQFTIIKSEVELIAILHETKAGQAIIQEFINKDEEIGIQGVGMGSCDAEPIITSVVHKVRTSLTAPGSTTYASIEPVSESEPIEACKKYIKENGYSGLFDIELLRQGNYYYFIECNFRNGAYGYAYTRAGHNLPVTWINKADTCNKCADSTKSFLLMNEFADFKHVSNGQIRLIPWLKQFINSDIHLTANKKDMWPFIFRILYH